MARRIALIDLNNEIEAIAIIGIDLCSRQWHIAYRCQSRQLDRPAIDGNLRDEGMLRPTDEYFETAEMRRKGSRRRLETRACDVCE